MKSIRDYMNVVESATNVDTDDTMVKDYGGRTFPVNASLISEFHERCKKLKTYSSSKSDYAYFSIRDNCGPACFDFIEFAASKGLKLIRVRGEFKCDEVLSEKKDFTKEMIKELKIEGLDFNNAEHRKRFIESSSKYSEEWKLCPHYWCVDSGGKIYDPSGYMQFIKTKLAKDLKPNRYILYENICL